MTNYVWQATDRSGKRVVREVAAESAEAARVVLVNEGCTDLSLLESEVGEAATAAFPKTFTVMGEEVKVTTAERMKHLGKPSPTFGRVLLDGIGQSKGLVLFMLVLAGVLFFSGYRVSALFAGVGLLCWLFFILTVGMPGVLYGKLHKAGDWYRWDEVLELVVRLEKLRGIHVIKVPLPELGRWRAKAWAGTGRLAEALQHYHQKGSVPHNRI